MQWRMTAILRAIATLAFFMAMRLISRTPHALRVDHFLVRCTRTLAASNRYVRNKRSPHREIGFPRLLAARGKPEISANFRRRAESRRIIDRMAERQRRDDADAGHAHEPPNRFVVTRTAAHIPVKFGLLLGDALMNRQ